MNMDTTIEITWETNMEYSKTFIFLDIYVDIS